MLGVRQWRHGAFCVSRQHRARRRRPRRILMCLLIVCESKFIIGESRTIFHANDTQAQQVAPNPRRGRFSTETPLEGERRPQIQREPRSRRNIAEHSEGNADNYRQRNRRLESAALWLFTVENPSPPIYVNQSLQSFSSVLRPEQ